MLSVRELLQYPNVIRDNIEEVYIQAGVDEHLESSQWYPLAHSFCLDLANKYNRSHIQVSGICSALSPQKSWPENQRITEDYLKGRNKHNKVQIGKCKEIVKTNSFEEIMSILNGEKTKSFFANIYNPKDSTYITIDRHILAICLGEKCTDVTVRQYHLLKDIIVDYAKEKNVHPVDFQSLLWVTWRKIKNYKYEKSKSVPGPF